MSGIRSHTLTTPDGERLSAMHRPGAGRDLGLVVVHGFTGNWRQERVRSVIEGLAPFGGVVALDMRGHGASTGATTMGDDEVIDVATAVTWARELGYASVVTVGFSLGGAVALREGALEQDGDGRVDAVVSVSSPAFWFYRGTRIMRIAHWMVETSPGRMVMRVRRTRISSRMWVEPYPVPPADAAGMLGSIPLLVVHGDADHYFPLEHPRSIQRSAALAGSPVELWVEPGMGHAEAAITPELLDRIGAWTRQACGLPPLVSGGEGVRE